MQRLNDLEFDVYSTILTLNENVIGMKIRRLAAEAHVSTTVVLNFCKKMDCNGWTAFKIKYGEYLRNNNKSITTTTEPILNYFEMYEQDEEKQKELDDIVRLICKSRKVIFIGAGPSGVLAKYGALYLSSMGKPTQYIDSPYYSIPEEDCKETIVIALSVSGETVSVINRLSRFKSLQATLISFTNSDNNTISKMVDIPVKYYVPQEEFNIVEKTEQIHVTMTTQIPVLHLIETISKKILWANKIDPQLDS
ncbi:MurR/RpiR family transcriptional regulator [Alkalicella caledoniensis]|uniref:MurR/RpiR family transcriptional regulator n=1 Tax=Alkalicella caledoniensis TaxID=2731377 RepID=A0A7G9W5U3_ALKCA|nr:MurR/RpiR family transcriptional regulator [Alkalicella caledoniensis]QNO14055.1 MurR/RpiR family transcriptional regulator [Alkalicella caledoniensis]